MPVQPITYRTVAAATRSRFFLADELDRRAIGDPERTFVIFMCAYACDVARRACRPLHRRRRAPLRACLIPAELLERSTLDIDHAAVALRVPAAELRAARAEHQGGGTIYDLAAPLYGYPARGADFLRLRAELRRLFGLKPA